MQGGSLALPDSYTVKPGSIPAYFDALLNADAPDRVTVRFLENLEFKSTNDRAFIGILKSLGFIDTDGVPTERYFQFLDRSQASRVVAEGVRDAFGDLFAVHKAAHGLSTDEVKNKLRTLYKGAKKEGIISRIASTFTALCEYGDFSARPPSAARPPGDGGKPPASSEDGLKGATDLPPGMGSERPPLSVEGLQYHINIVLPESRDQAVYDAIFKSLRDHLGPSA